MGTGGRTGRGEVRQAAGQGRAEAGNVRGTMKVRMRLVGSGSPGCWLVAGTLEGRKLGTAPAKGITKWVLDPYEVRYP